MMRRTILIVAALAFAALSASCGKQPGAQGAEPFILGVGLNEPSTRTSVGEKNGENMYPLLWSTGDAIAVNGAASKPLAEEAAGSASAEFAFASKPAAASVYNVVYPQGESATSVFFGQGKVPVAGSTADLDGGVTLRTPATIIRFVMKGSATLSSMEISAPAGEKISGSFTLGTDGAGAVDGSLTPDAGASSSMSCSFGGGLALSGEGNAIVFFVPHGAYANGLRASVTASDGKKMTLCFFASGAVLPAATVCAFPEITWQAGKEVVFATGGSFSGETADLEEEAGIAGMDAGDASAAVSVTVGSYNIWAPSARYNYWNADGNHYDGTVSEQRSWANSYRAVADMINWLDCDVIGLQEVTKMVYQTTLTSGNADYDGNVHTLNSLLGNYSWVIYNQHNTSYDNLSNNTTANGLGSTDAILYKRSVLTLVSKGRAWLNGTRTKAPQDATWDEIGTNRPATWAKFTHKASGKQFVFIVTHLDLPDAGEESDPAYPQRRNAQELITWFAPTYAGDLPSVIVGDMNVDSGDNYAILTSGRWQDVYDAMLSDGSLSYTEKRFKGTMNASKNEADFALSTWRPDHILTYGFTPSYYRVGRETFATADGTQHWPSDHFPVKAVLNFQED